MMWLFLFVLKLYVLGFLIALVFSIGLFSYDPIEDDDDGEHGEPKTET